MTVHGACRSARKVLRVADPLGRVRISAQLERDEVADFCCAAYEKASAARHVLHGAAPLEIAGTLGPHPDEEDVLRPRFLIVQQSSPRRMATVAGDVRQPAVCASCYYYSGRSHRPRAQAIGPARLLPSRRRRGVTRGTPLAYVRRRSVTRTRP